MFNQIDISLSKRVTGVNNGVYQVEIDEDFLEKNDNFCEIEKIFYNYDVNLFLQNQQDVFDLKIPKLKAKLVKGAKFTDIMAFSPFVFGFKYIVSQKFVDCLIEINISKSEFKIIPIEIQNAKTDYYLFFTPMISDKEIIFSKSLVYPERDFLEENKNYYKIENYNSYLKLLDKNLFNRWEKVMLNKKYKNYNIVNVQSINNLFFSRVLTEKFESKKIDSLVIKNQINLCFSTD